MLLVAKLNRFGGGIFNYNTGTVLVESSTFAENSASGDKDGVGGGIDNQGKVTVVNSTFSKNSASGSKGSTGFGGGISNHDTGTILVEASTFSGNSASGDHNSQGGGIDNRGKEYSRTVSLLRIALLTTRTFQVH